MTTIALEKNDIYKLAKRKVSSALCSASPSTLGRYPNSFTHQQLMCTCDVGPVTNFPMIYSIAKRDKKPPPFLPDVVAGLVVSILGVSIGRFCAWTKEIATYPNASASLRLLHPLQNNFTSSQYYTFTSPVSTIRTLWCMFKFPLL